MAAYVPWQKHAHHSAEEDEQKCITLAIPTAVHACVSVLEAAARFSNVGSEAKLQPALLVQHPAKLHADASQMPCKCSTVMLHGVVRGMFLPLDCKITLK